MRVPVKLNIQVNRLKKIFFMNFSNTCKDIKPKVGSTSVGQLYCSARLEPGKVKVKELINNDLSVKKAYRFEVQYRFQNTNVNMYYISTQWQTKHLNV